MATWSYAARWGRQAFLLLAPLVTVLTVAAGVLYVVGALPGQLRHEEASGPRTYASIAEAQRDLRLRLLIPGYFPSELVWPPAAIVGQREPFPMLTASFQLVGGEEMVLLVRTVKGEGLPDTALPAISQLTGEWEDVLNRRQVRFVAGLDEAGMPVALAWWSKGDEHFIIWTALGAEALRRMVETTPLG